MQRQGVILNLLIGDTQLDNSTELLHGYNFTSVDDRVLSLRKKSVFHACQRQGYVLALSYQDQITSALRRLASLQCWAAQFNMAVVEPFLPHGSPFPGVPSTGLRNGLQFRELFDLDHWNILYGRTRFAPLVSWDEFLHCAPKELTTVQIVHQVYETSHCTYPQLNKHWWSYLEPHGFRLSKEVCIDMNTYGLMNGEDFSRLVFGKHSREVTLVFDTWRGIRNESKSEADKAITIKSVCTNYFGRLVAFEGWVPSPQVMQDAEVYKQKYFGGGKYTAIMIRLEYILLLYDKEDIGICLSKIKGLLRCLVRDQNGSRPIFLSTDVGKYGTQSLEEYNISDAYTTGFIQEILGILYSNNRLLEQYERTFEDIAHDDNPVYVATLQKTLASQAECLILIGGGSFQKQTETWYMQRRGKQCLWNFQPGKCRDIDIGSNCEKSDFFKHTM